MDEKKILDQIKKSADNLDIPDSLKPDNIEEKIKSSNPKKKGTVFAYKMGGLAAVLLLTLIVVWQVGRIGRLSEENTAETNAFVQEQESQNVAEDAAEFQKTIVHAESYEEIYQALSKFNEEESISMYSVPDERSMAKEGVADDAGVNEAETTASLTESADMSATGQMTMDHSETNLQELGVDEADIIKTDGNYIYVVKGNGKICIVRAVKGNMELTDTIKLPNLSESIEEMYLDGDTLSLITRGSTTALEEGDENVYDMNSSQYVKIYTWDIEDRANPKLLGSITQEGWYRESRKNGSYIYLFTEYAPEIKERQDTSQFIPKVQEEDVQIDDIFLPQTLNSSNYLVITSMNINTPDKVEDKKVIVSAANMFYVSTENIYICNNNWTGDRNTTQIMKFHYENGKLQAVAAGEVPGSLNNSFSLNENDGYLRMVTTSWDSNIDTNNLYVLDSNMEICGSLDNLAPGETIQSARFMGNIGYFVTFRQIDPLFSVDLTDPRNPMILGELKITGFSSYLHFYGENKLLGIGNEVDPETGEYKGLKLSMFDISDSTNVTETDKYILKDVYYSPGLYNYKAIMIDPEKNIFGFLAEETYVVFKYEKEGGFINLFARNMIDGGDDSYYYDTRGLYIGDTLYLFDYKKIRAFDMTNEFTEIGIIDL